MKVIWKYVFNISDEIQSYDIPLAISDGLLHANAHVEMQNGSLCMWTVVEPANNYVKCDFKVVGTGHKFDKGTRVGSAQSGSFVWHLILIKAHLS